jgi:hypothetical protein
LASLPGQQRCFALACCPLRSKRKGLDAPHGGGLAGHGVITITNTPSDHYDAVSGSHDTGSSGGSDAAAAYGSAICTNRGGLVGFSGSFTASNCQFPHRHRQHDYPERRRRGRGGRRGSDGQGIGGGLDLAAGGIVCLGATTIVKKHHASTSNDNIFGVFTTCS